MLRKFLDQERAPIFTAASVFVTLLTLAVLALIMLASRGSSAGWERLGLFFGAGATGAVGLILNVLAGFIAQHRGELHGPEIALRSAALCFLAAAAVSLFWVSRP